MLICYSQNLEYSKKVWCLNTILFKILFLFLVSHTFVIKNQANVNETKLWWVSITELLPRSGQCWAFTHFNPFLMPVVWYNFRKIQFHLSLKKFRENLKGVCFWPKNDPFTPLWAKQESLLKRPTSIFNVHWIFILQCLIYLSKMIWVFLTKITA